MRLQPRFEALCSPLFRLTAGEGVSIPAAFERRAGSGSPLWVVTTFDRKSSCKRLVGELGDAASANDVEPLVVVVHDACACDYGEVRDALEQHFGERAVFIEMARRLDKPEFWRIHQFVFDLVRTLDPPFVLCLQDDIELAPGWFEEAWSIIRGLDDPAFAALSLHCGPDDEIQGRWIRFPRQPTPCGRAWLTQRLDLPASIATPRLYRALDHRLRPIPRLRWAWDPTKSSGVGCQITRRLFAHDVNVYRVARPLAYHGSRPSLMNPEARARRPMDNHAKAGRRGGSRGAGVSVGAGRGGWRRRALEVRVHEVHERASRDPVGPL